MSTSFRFARENPRFRVSCAKNEEELRMLRQSSRKAAEERRTAWSSLELPEKPGAVLLRTRQQQGEKLGPAFAVDDSVDEIGAKAALESDHCLLLVGHVIAETLEGE